MKDVNIDGYDIPAKTRFFVNAWAVGRDLECWENPDIFEPERFMDSPIDFKGQHFQLIPFGVGRRSCPAITFGTASIELALAQLLHGFDWELPPGVTAKDLDMTEVFGITMHRIANLIVIAKPRFPLDHANDNPKTQSCTTLCLSMPKEEKDKVEESRGEWFPFILFGCF